jgi:hypothetical protein
MTKQTRPDRPDCAGLQHHYGRRNFRHAECACDGAWYALYLPFEQDADEDGKKEKFAAMDAESDRCARELSDARVDVLCYACLVANMSMGKPYHRVSQDRLHGRTSDAYGG